MTVIERDGRNVYYDKRLLRNLDKIKIRVNDKDQDFFWGVDGEERSGKSVLAMQLAWYVDPTFNLSRVCYTPQEFKKAIQQAKKGQAIVFDEAFRGMSSNAAMDKINRELVTLLMECGQKNLFVFIVLPTIFMLSKYVALWRTRGLFHVYTKKGKRGYWQYYNKKKKKKLYLEGKKDYSYTIPRTNFRGRFLEQYVLEENEYRKKKREALEQYNVEEVEESPYLDQRNRLLKYLHEHEGLSYRELAELCDQLGIKLKAAAINQAVRKLEKIS